MNPIVSLQAGASSPSAHRAQSRRLAVLAFYLLVGVVCSSAAFSQSSQPSSAHPAGQQPPAASAPHHFRFHPNVPRREVQYYNMIWGVDSLGVKWTESGEIIRFTYRVVDPGKAVVLNDKKFEPSLVDPEAGVKLVVPSLEKVGKLRQSAATLEAGKSYWMAFSNKGRYVKKGHHVDVVIGNFRAQGLVVN